MPISEREEHKERTNVQSWDNAKKLKGRTQREGQRPKPRERPNTKGREKHPLKSKTQASILNLSSIVWNKLDKREKGENSSLKEASMMAMARLKMDET
jgi:hypothetical protein